jgi:N-acetylglucosamine-6-phosphate deacetylase
MTTAFTGANIFDGERWHEGAALVIGSDAVETIGAVPAGAETIALNGGMLVPGFVDLQVNGGGGALLNEVPTVEGIRTICSAHARYGTTALLPTLVTDVPAVVNAAIAAGIASKDIPGFLGLHLEGPHLSVARKGAHDPKLIRPMEQEDLAALVAGRKQLPHLLSTVAAETVTPLQIDALTSEGIVVSIGHSDATFATVAKAAGSGATMVTHLFNAQSQLGNREPGVVGAALAIGTLNAGLIADGIHVHPEAIGIALRAKRGPGKIFLVTDAMSVTGTDATEFMLNGRKILRRGRALRLEDGTLAGADLTMIEAITFIHKTVGLPLEEALRMATVYPAEAIGAPRHGHLRAGARADFVHLGDDLSIRSTWINASRVFAA